jgi:hypothetical protein
MKLLHVKTLLDGLGNARAAVFVAVYLVLGTIPVSAADDLGIT